MVETLSQLKDPNCKKGDSNSSHIEALGLGWSGWLPSQIVSIYWVGNETKNQLSYYWTFEDLICHSEVKRSEKSSHLKTKTSSILTLQVTTNRTMSLGCLFFSQTINTHTHTHTRTHTHTHYPLICEQAESAAPLRVTELCSLSFSFSCQAYNFTVLVHCSQSIFGLQKKWLFFAEKPIKTHTTLHAQPQTADRHN